MESVGTSDGKSYDVIPRTMGLEMLCLRGVVENTSQKLDGFIIPDSMAKNDRALYYEVVKAGADVEEITGIREGDFVFVDALARFADTYPISFINCRNAVMKTDLEGKAIVALKHKVIARIIEPSFERDEATGFMKVSMIDPYGEIVSIGEGCEDRGYKLGDRVSVSSNGDSFMMGSGKYFIYDWRVPMFKFARDKEGDRVRHDAFGMQKMV